MTLRRGREEAAAAIWRWKADDAGSVARRARLGGIVRAIVGAAIGGVALGFGHPHVAWVAWGLTALLLALALGSPLGGYAFFLRAMNASGRLVGWIVAAVLLTPVYLLFFVPFRVLFRRGTRDRMTRRADPNATTYWKTRTENDQVMPMKRPY